MALFLLALAPPAAAQSLTTGALDGVVRDSIGQPIGGAGVSVVADGTGVSRSVQATHDGGFAFPFLPPGSYALRVEQFGYRPLRIEGIVVRAGQRAGVVATLAAAVATVDRVDVVRYDAVPRLGAGQDFSSLETERLPSPLRELGDLARLSSGTAADLAVEGLPPSATAVVVDGLRHEVVRHPAFPTDPFRTAAIPLPAVGRARLGSGDVDVELPDAAGGQFVAFTRRGGRDFSFHGFGTWSGDLVSSSDYFLLPPHSTVQAGFVASGPLIRDTASFIVGLEERHLEAPLPRAWQLASVAAATRAIAHDSFGVTMPDFGRPRVARTQALSGFARVDWQVTQNHALAVRANFATLPFVQFQSGSLGTPTDGGTAHGEDIAAAATLTSVLGDRLSQEVRLGFGHSARAYLPFAGAAPWTGIVAGGLAVGGDPLFPARFQRTTLSGVQSLHYRAAAHRLKAGAALEYESFDDRYTFGESGRFLFGAPGAFARHEGLFQETADGPAYTPFSIARFGLFLQDTWSAVPGLELTAGLRFDYEKLPVDDIRLDERWLALTGLANNDVNASLPKFAPRVGLTWDIQDRHRWLVHAAAGVHYDRVDPAIAEELLASDGRPVARRAFGDLGGWPTPTFSAATLDTGSVLTVLGPDFAAPRTTRASLGLSLVFGSGTVLRVSGAMRRTNFLPRREDLNLAPNAIAEDQYGRPIYGTLVKQGALLAAEPGSNRRFDDYDRVYAISADGYSDYRGVTLGLEHRTSGALAFFGSYTYSRTEDDWLSALGGAPDDGLSPFPGGLDGGDWADGRSDLDVPHRAVVGAELSLSQLAGLRFATVYRYRSGDPFTPGFRYGVDANGDGSPGNDPAFVDDEVPGIAELIAGQICLRRQVGGFAERNVCRMPGVHALDVRFGIGLPRIGGVASELVVDGFNLLESDVGIPDRALYLVDGGQPLVVDPVSGRVTVPLVANPHFGKLLSRWDTGRMVRIGLRVDY